MSLSPAEQTERADVVKRVNQYNGAKGSAAAKRILKIERQCRRSQLESQRCYVFENTLNCDSLGKWFYGLDETVQNDFDEPKRRLLRRQQPPEFHLDLKEKWEGLVQLEDQTPEDYAIELKTLIDQIDPKFRPPQIGRTLKFWQGLRPDIKTQMQARSEEFENWDEVVKEAQMVATDLGKKKRRPRGLLRTTSITTEDRDLEQSLAEYEEEYRASLIQQGQGEETVSAISDHRRKQDPCNYGPLCKWNAKGLCKFDHSSDKSWILCRYARDGKKCKRQEDNTRTTTIFTFHWSPLHSLKVFYLYDCLQDPL